MERINAKHADEGRASRFIKIRLCSVILLRNQEASSKIDKEPIRAKTENDFHFFFLLQFPRQKAKFFLEMKPRTSNENPPTRLRSALGSLQKHEKSKMNYSMIWEGFTGEVRSRRIKPTLDKVLSNLT